MTGTVQNLGYYCQRLQSFLQLMFTAKNTEMLLEMAVVSNSASLNLKTVFKLKQHEVSLPPHF